MPPSLLTFLGPLLSNNPKEHHALSEWGRHPLFDKNVVGIVLDFSQSINPCCSLTWQGVGKATTQITHVVFHPTRQLLFAIHDESMCSFRTNGELAARWRLFPFDSPRTLALHPTLDLLFVANHLEVYAFNLDGTVAFTWMSESFISGLALDATDNHIYLAHNDMDSVGVYTMRGHLVRTLSTPTPRSLVVHSNQDRLFVASNRCIRVFSRNGTLLHQWKRSQRSTTMHLAVHPTRDWLFVSDCSEHRVQIHQLDGKLLRNCHQNRFDPLHIAVDPVGNVVYVVNGHANNAIDAIELLPIRAKNKKKTEN